MLTFDSSDFFLNLFALAVVVVPLYWLLRTSWAREAVLAVSGALLLFWIAPRLLLFYIVFWLIVAVLEFVVESTAESRFGMPALGSAILLLLGVLVLWRLAETWFIVNFNLKLNSALGQFSTRLHEIDMARDIITPIGVSFAVFRAIDLLVKTNLGIADPRSVRRTIFIGFFPTIQVIGPVAESTELRVAKTRAPQLNDLREALMLIATGLFRVFVVAHLLSRSADVLVFYESNNAPVLWLELALYGVFFYFNFAGYSDLAIGAARLFGIRLNDNFDSPLTKTNPQDFWNSWHMSLSRFAQRYVFVPLGGVRANRQYVAIFATIMVIALWHNISIPLVIFGLYHGAGLIFHRMAVARWQPRTSRGWIATKVVLLFWFYALSIPLISLDVSSIGPFYRSLLGV